jgi:hypothetical protein
MTTPKTLLTLLLGVPVLLAADTTIHVPELDVLDQELRALSCTVSEGGFLAGPAVVASLAGRKAALDACASDGAALRVRWTWEGEAGADIAAVDGAPAELTRCVEAALQAVPEAIDGACEGVLLIGEPNGAEQAAASLVTAGHSAASGS